MCTAEELEHNSPLEMLSFLGKLQEPRYPLSKPKGLKGKDLTLKLPMLGCADELAAVPGSTQGSDEPMHAGCRW